MIQLVRLAALYQRIPRYNNITKIAAADHSVPDSDMVYIKIEPQEYPSCMLVESKSLAMRCMVVNWGAVDQFIVEYGINIF